MNVSWEELRMHVARGDSRQLCAADLVELVWRAMQPCNFIALAWMFAAQGEVLLWMHTLTSALRVLKRPDWVHEFAVTYFTDENAAACHQNVRPHWDTMRLMFQGQDAYRSPTRSDRDEVLAGITLELGEHATSLPLSSEEAAKNPINGNRGNAVPQHRR